MGHARGKGRADRGSGYGRSIWLAGLRQPHSGAGLQQPAPHSAQPVTKESGCVFEDGDPFCAVPFLCRSPAPCEGQDVQGHLPF